MIFYRFLLSVFYELDNIDVMRVKWLWIIVFMEFEVWRER